MPWIVRLSDLLEMLLLKAGFDLKLPFLNFLVFLDCSLNYSISLTKPAKRLLLDGVWFSLLAYQLGFIHLNLLGKSCVLRLLSLKDMLAQLAEFILHPKRLDPAFVNLE